MIGRLFSGDGGGKAKVIVGVVAGAVTLALVGWMILNAFAGPPLPRNIRYECVHPECGHQGRVSAEDLEKLPYQMAYGITPSLMLRCPKCKEWSYFEQRTCGHCNRWYVTDAQKMSTKDFRKVPLTHGGVPPDRCPHCGKLQFGSMGDAKREAGDAEPNQE